VLDALLEYINKSEQVEDFMILTRKS